MSSRTCRHRIRVRVKWTQLLEGKYIMADENVTEAGELLAKATEHLYEKTGGTDVFVPVTNSNYLPEGIVRLEGWVPPINGGNLDDLVVLKHKAALEDDPLNKLESGAHEDNNYVDPNETEEDSGGEETISPNEPGDSQAPAPTDENPDRTSPENQENPSLSNTSGLK